MTIANIPKYKIFYLLKLKDEYVSKIIIKNDDIYFKTTNKISEAKKYMYMYYPFPKNTKRIFYNNVVIIKPKFDFVRVLESKTIDIFGDKIFNLYDELINKLYELKKTINDIAIIGKKELNYENPMDIETEYWLEKFKECYFFENDKTKFRHLIVILKDGTKLIRFYDNRIYKEIWELL